MTLVKLNRKVFFLVAVVFAVGLWSLNLFLYVRNKKAKRTMAERNAPITVIPSPADSFIQPRMSVGLSSGVTVGDNENTDNKNPTDNRITIAARRCVAQGGQVVGKEVCYFPSNKISPSSDSGKIKEIRGIISDISDNRLTMTDTGAGSNKTFTLTENTQIYLSTQYKENSADKSVRILNAKPFAKEKLAPGKNIYVLTDIDNHVVALYVLDRPT